MITGMAHICFTSRDLDRSLNFYCQKLGLKHAFDFINDKGVRFGVFISLGGRSFLELFQGELNPAVPAPAYRHFCLEVDDIHKTVADLRAAGVEVTDAKRAADNTWQAWLSDPDGNRIELHHYTPKSLQAPHLQPVK